jgi:hypothetical protein
MPDHVMPAIAVPPWFSFPVFPLDLDLYNPCWFESEISSISFAGSLYFSTRGALHGKPALSLHLLRVFIKSGTIVAA